MLDVSWLEKIELVELALEETELVVPFRFSKKPVPAPTMIRTTTIVIATDRVLALVMVSFLPYYISKFLGWQWEKEAQAIEVVSSRIGFDWSLIRLG